MSLQKQVEIEGSCHCGNIHLVLHWPGSSVTMGARVCGCTFCTKHAGAWTSHRDAALRVEISDKSMVEKYRFATKTADFYVCSACGVVPFALSNIENRAYAVVNVNALEDVDKLLSSRSATDFNGEERNARLERRSQNWIPDVDIVSKRKANACQPMGGC